VARVRRLVAARIGFTTAALGLLMYWGRPFGQVEKLLHVDVQLQTAQLAGGPEVFILSALMTLLGAIWLVMYNSDLLIRGVMFFTGRIGGLAAVTRTSMSYPMATKFRTGMAVAMFAIVTFIIVYTSVFKDVLVQNFAQVDAVSGGWQIVAGTPDNSFNQTDQTRFPPDVAGLVRSNPAVSSELSAIGWENQSVGVQLQQVNADGSLGKIPSDRGYAVRVVDDGYLSATGYGIQPRAAGYTSDRAVWDAVRDNTGYAVLNASTLDASNGNTANIVGIKPTDPTFKPFKVQVANHGSNGVVTSTWTLTVIGFQKSTALWGGVYVSTRTALASGLFVAPATSATPPNALPTVGGQLLPTGYYFSVKPGVDVNKARLDLGRMLVQGPARAGHRRRPAGAAAQRHPHAAQPCDRIPRPRPGRRHRRPGRHQHARCGGTVAADRHATRARVQALARPALVSHGVEPDCDPGPGHRRHRGRVAVIPLFCRRQELWHRGLPRARDRDRAHSRRRLPGDSGHDVPTRAVGVAGRAGGGAQV